MQQNFFIHSTGLANKQNNHCRNFLFCLFGIVEFFNVLTFINILNLPSYHGSHSYGEMETKTRQMTVADEISISFFENKANANEELIFEFKGFLLKSRWFMNIK